MNGVFKRIVLSAGILVAFAPLFHAAFLHTLQPAVVMIEGGMLIDEPRLADRGVPMILKEDL